jgi:hypothetical protein
MRACSLVPTFLSRLQKTSLFKDKVPMWISLRKKFKARITAIMVDQRRSFKNRKISISFLSFCLQDFKKNIEVAQNPK